MPYTHSYFSTLTINNWISLFEDFPKCYDVIYETLTYLTKENIVTIYAFVVMRDHMHLLWKPSSAYEIITVVTKFKKFTGRKFRSHLQLYDSDYLDQYFMSNRKDRNFKFWKINSSNLLTQHQDIFIQKINYIHENPTKGDYKVCNNPIEYYHSSANSYKLSSSEFPFLTLVI